MESTEQIRPKARKAGLIITQLADETLVYDTQTQQAHCLNQQAALVWEHCDGQTTIPDLVRKLQPGLKEPIDEQWVWYGLDGLTRIRLLEEKVDLPVALAGMSRRSFLRILGATAVAVPVILTLTPSKVAAAGGSCLPNGSSCTTNPQCCSGHCDATNHCANSQHGGPMPLTTAVTGKINGQSCTSSTECASGQCISGHCIGDATPTR